MADEGMGKHLLRGAEQAEEERHGRLPNSSLAWPMCMDDIDAHLDFAQDVLECVGRHGYCIIDHEEDDDAFIRKALDEAETLQYSGTCLSEFSAAYLGKDNKTDFALLPPDNPSEVPNRSHEVLHFCDRRMTKLALWLRIQATAVWEQRLETRLNTIVRKPRPGEKTQVDVNHLIDTDEHAVAEQVFGHLNFLNRRALCILCLLTTESSRLLLIADKKPGIQALWNVNITVSADQGSRMIVFEPKLFNYHYTPSTCSVALQTWLLTAPYLHRPSMCDTTVVVPRHIHDGHVWVEGCRVRLPGSSYESSSELRSSSTMFTAGADAALQVPLSRFDMELYYVPDMDDACSTGKSYAKHGSFCPDAGVVVFDKEAFDMGQEDVALVNPAHRMLMELGYELLMLQRHERLPSREKAIGLFVGDAGSDSDEAVHDTLMYALSGEGLTMTSAVGAAILLRVFDLKGPVTVIDTACSSSLVAFHVAHSALQKETLNTSKTRSTSKIEMAIPMGVNCLLAPRRYLYYSAAAMLSSNGRCFTFDASGDGFLRGEAAGALLLNLLSGNEQDHWICSAGCAVKQDGRSASLTAPNGPSQSSLITASLMEAGFQPAELNTMECHGLGTPLGDSIEWSALCRAIGTNGCETPCTVGSAKTNCGHSEAAAGTVGLCKCICMTTAALNFASQHLRDLNSNVELDYNSNMELATEIVDIGKMAWIAAVSSFGSGGTNAHADQWATALCGDVQPRSGTWSDWARLGDRCASVYDRSAQHGRPGPQPADRVYIQGSWSGWREMTQMKRDAGGEYHSITVALDRFGEESFQLVLNEDVKRTFHPVMAWAEASEQNFCPGRNGSDNSLLLRRIEEAHGAQVVFRVWLFWKFDWVSGEIARIWWEEASLEDEAENIDIDCAAYERRYFLALEPTIGKNQEMSRTGDHTWERLVCLRAGAAEMFQILRDNDPMQAIYPIASSVPAKGVVAAGPDHLGTGSYWVMESHQEETVAVCLNLSSQFVEVKIRSSQGKMRWCGASSSSSRGPLRPCEEVA